MTGRGVRFALMAVLAAALAGPAARVRADDTPEKIQKELAEKIAKAIKKAEEAQGKLAEKQAKRAREDAEDRTEPQEEARERARKEARKAARRDAEARKDTAKLDAEALDEMEDRVERYVKKVHKKALKDVGALPAQATPEQMATHQKALADAIRAMRPQARQGDFFVPECQPIVKRILSAELSGRAGAPARKEMLSGNPSVDPDRDDRMAVKLSVNTPYPAAAPLSNVPPSVLLTLPLLPKEVEYRFVNRDLILHDVDANLILDFLPRAAPPITTTPTPGGPRR